MHARHMHKMVPVYMHASNRILDQQVLQDMLTCSCQTMHCTMKGIGAGSRLRDRPAGAEQVRPYADSSAAPFCSSPLCVQHMLRHQARCLRSRH